MNKGEFVLREDVDHTSIYKPNQGYNIRESTLFEKPGVMKAVMHYSGIIGLNRSTVKLLYDAIMYITSMHPQQIHMGVSTLSNLRLKSLSIWIIPEDRSCESTHNG